MTRFADISMSLQNDVPADPPGYEFSIEYISHQDTLPMLQRPYDGLQPDELPNAETLRSKPFTCQLITGRMWTRRGITRR